MAQVVSGRLKSASISILYIQLDRKFQICFDTSQPGFRDLPFGGKQGAEGLDTYREITVQNHTTYIGVSKIMPRIAQ